MSPNFEMLFAREFTIKLRNLYSHICIDFYTGFMRLWSIHPRYLDGKGLVALWREALLAQKVLHGGTKGYKNHPQLNRFRLHSKPTDAIAVYLASVQTEATVRGYSFDKTRIALEVTEEMTKEVGTMEVTDGQMAYEWAHLRRKLKERSPDVLKKHGDVDKPDAHPILKITKGDIADWERV